MGIISTVAGDGDYPAGWNPYFTDLYWPSGIAQDPDGSLYIVSSLQYKLKKQDPNGILATVAGNGSLGVHGGAYSGDGGPAVNAMLGWDIGVALGPDGSIYIADTSNHRIRRIGSDGIITTVVGNGNAGFSGDGGPAVQAELNNPYGVAVGHDGSIYIADSSNNRIRKVDPGGTITTVAGNGAASFGGDEGPAAQAQLWFPCGITVGPDGTIYIADTANNRVRKVGPDGIIHTIAGSGQSGFSGDGGAAVRAELDYPEGVAVGPDGSIYVGDAYNYRVRRIGTDGMVTTVAGNGTSGYSGDGSPAVKAEIGFSYGLTVGHDGKIYTSGEDFCVRAISPTLPGFSSGDILIPSEDGRLVYRFDSTGRHLSTLNALTGAVLYQFGYDGSGFLATITDGSGNVTTIEHDANGNPVAIVSPRGQKTALAVDANGYLSAITDPAGDARQFAYGPGGILTSMTTPNGSAYGFTYDGYGRLSQDGDPAGGSKSLVRTEDATGYNVAVTTGLGRTTNYSLHRNSTGAIDHLVISPDGTKSESVSGTDGSKTSTYSDGTSANSVQSPDPRFGMLAPLVANTTTTPGGLSLTSATSLERPFASQDASLPQPR